MLKQIAQQKFIKMKPSKIIKLIISIVLPLGIGAIAGMYTAKAVPTWYASLIQPSFNPPNWIFGPVWTTLYLLLGLSLFIIWNGSPSKKRTKAFIVFAVQLSLNFCWSFLFFYFNQIGYALIEIILLWINILAMLFLFFKIKPIAAYINIPYLLWVSFAAILNAAYYFLNK